MAAWYIHPADPVYQVQPARPTCIGCEYTSAAMTYGSARYGSRRPRVRVWLMGLIMWNSSIASSPCRSLASATIVHTAACVYWPPFSRNPGR